MTKMKQVQDPFLIPEYFLKIKLAGINIEVRCKNIRDFYECGPYLSDFGEPDFTVKASEKEIADAYKQKKNVLSNAVKGVVIDELRGIESQIVLQKITDRMIGFNTLLMHGSVVALDGRAYMFTAPSGVGKTTRTRIWIDEFPESIVVNGDKPFLRVTDSNVFACGSPWCGKEKWNTNTTVPLQAIFLLERADDTKKNVITRIDLASAVPVLLKQTFLSDAEDALLKTVRLLKEFEGKVNIYRLCCTPTKDAIRLAYETAGP